MSKYFFFLLSLISVEVRRFALLMCFHNFFLWIFHEYLFVPINIELTSINFSSTFEILVLHGFEIIQRDEQSRRFSRQ